MQADIVQIIIEPFLHQQITIARLAQHEFAQKNRADQNPARADAGGDPRCVVAVVQNPPNQKKQGDRDRRRQNIIIRRRKPKRSADLCRIIFYRWRKTPNLICSIWSLSQDFSSTYVKYFKTKSQILLIANFPISRDRQKKRAFVKDFENCCMVLEYERQEKEKARASRFRLDPQTDRAAEPKVRHG